MGSFVFNIARGRTQEFHRRVDNNDPANSALIAVVLRTAAIEPDSLLRVYDTLADILASTNDEPTNTGYARKTLADADLTAATIDDTLHRVILPFPTQTWTTVAAGDTWRKLLLCYDGDTTSGTDADIVPITAHDLLINGQPITPSGLNVVVAGSLGYVVAR